MAWDFSTEPEFQEQLDWMREFVRDGGLAAGDRLRRAGRGRASTAQSRRCKERGQGERGLFASHLPPELGGQGFGQVKLGLMHEILGMSFLAPFAFGNKAPDSGNSEILALAGTRGPEGAVAAPAARRRPALGVLDDRARAPPAADPTSLDTTAVLDGDEWVINGHKWFSTNASVADFLIVMVVTDPDAHKYQRASMIIVPADAPGVEMVRDVGDDGAPDRALRAHRRPRRDLLPRRPRPEGQPARRARRRLPDRPAAPRPGSHPPLHALAGCLSPRVRHALRALADAPRARLAAAPTSRRSRTGSPTRPPRCRRRG